jgi:Protein of unknown function (DUF3618)
MTESDRNLPEIPEPRVGPAEVGRVKRPDEIEQDIEATRDRLSRDIDELGEKLSSGNLIRQAGHRVFDSIRENPLPAVAMGLGTVWLLQRRGGNQRSGDGAVMAGAAVLGLALGLLIPATDKENRLLDRARDELADRAQATDR